MTQIEIPIKPMPYVRTTQRMKFSERYKNYTAWKRDCRMLCRVSGIKNLPSKLNIEFRIEMFDSYTEKQKEEKRGRPHEQKPDLDNLIKAFMDCFGKDDSHVSEIHARKVWADQASIIIWI